MEDKEAKIKKFEPHFPTTKIKKIIQENQDIGKLSNLVPPLVEQSLQFFLIDLLKQTELVAQEHALNKLTPAILKKALLTLNAYDFMKDSLDDVEDLAAPVPAKAKSNRAPPSKRNKSEAEVKEERKGRKKVKVADCGEESPHSEV